VIHQRSTYLFLDQIFPVLHHKNLRKASPIVLRAILSVSKVRWSKHSHISPLKNAGSSLSHLRDPFSITSMNGMYQNTPSWLNCVHVKFIPIRPEEISKIPHQIYRLSNDLWRWSDELFVSMLLVIRFGQFYLPGIIPSKFGSIIYSWSQYFL
jgi:hypothetical protein